MAHRGEVELSAGTIEYEDTGGEGPVAVLLHGVAMDGSLWREVVAGLRPGIPPAAPSPPPAGAAGGGGPAPRRAAGPRGGGVVVAGGRGGTPPGHPLRRPPPAAGRGRRSG